MQISTSLPGGSQVEKSHDGEARLTQVNISNGQGQTTSQRTVNSNGTQSYNLTNPDGTHTQFTLDRNGHIVKPVSVAQQN